MNYTINQKVKVPMGFGYAPLEATIIGFEKNKYNVECAVVKYNRDYSNDIRVRSLVPISSLNSINWEVVIHLSPIKKNFHKFINSDWQSESIMI